MKNSKLKLTKNQIRYRETPTYQFSIVLWDETGNILLEKHTMNVKRKSQRTAHDIVRRKYKFPYFIELNNIIITKNK